MLPKVSNEGSPSGKSRACIDGCSSNCPRVRFNYPSVVPLWHKPLKIFLSKKIQFSSKKKKVRSWWLQCLSESVSGSVVPISLQPHELQPTRLLCMGILQARILEWVVISFFRESYRPRDRTQVSRTAGRFFTVWATKEAKILSNLSP